METALSDRQSKGFTIVELMVTMAISAILIASIYGIFASQNRICGEEEQTIEMQQNARIAMKLLERDLRMAGFWGCGTTPDNFKNTVRGQDTNPLLSMLPVRGVNNLAEGNTYGAKVGTDLFIVSYADQDGGVRVDEPYMNNNSADIHLVDPGNPSPIKKGDIVLISDCQYTSVFQITNMQDSARSVVHNENQGGGNPDPANWTKDLGHKYAEGTFVYALKMKYYWISPDNQLMMSQGGFPVGGNAYQQTNSSQPIAENIEDLQLEYGVDSDGNGTPDQWYNASAVPNWNNVIAVRIFLLVRTTREVKDYTNTHTYAFADRPSPGPYNDRYPRYLLEGTTSLRNR